MDNGQLTIDNACLNAGRWHTNGEKLNSGRQGQWTMSYNAD